MITPQELQLARKAKSEWYQQKFGDIILVYQVVVCFSCNCCGSKEPTGHSRAHAHTKERKICLAYPPTSYGRFLSALHEIGHIVAERADYNKGYPRAEAEHNATQWAFEKMRELGLPIKRKHKAKYDAYISNKIARGLRRGLSYVPPILRKYGVVS